jgi:hypothetical protein
MARPGRATSESQMSAILEVNVFLVASSKSRCGPQVYDPPVLCRTKFPLAITTRSHIGQVILGIAGVSGVTAGFPGGFYI